MRHVCFKVRSHLQEANMTQVANRGCFMPLSCYLTQKTEAMFSKSTIESSMRETNIFHGRSRNLPQVCPKYHLSYE
jgi:hypothetical protein